MHTTNANATHDNDMETTTMKGITQTRFGEPGDVLRVADVARPNIPHDGVLVRVRAAAIHVGLVYTVRGYPKVLRPMFRQFIADNGVIGLDLAGIVEATGPDVTTVAVGDEVLGSGVGTHAQYAVTTQDELVSKPDSLSFEQASALGVSAFTALQALRDHGQLTEGQHVLVTGASGGVGTFAVQIAKAMGAEVTGVCSTRNLDLVGSLGADHVIDYTRQDFTTGEARYDLILDNVGAQTLSDMRRVLTADGLLLANGAPAPRGWFGGLGHVLKVAVSSVFHKRQGRPFLATGNAEDRRALQEMAAAGTVTPVIDRVFPLAEAVDAVTAVGEGHNRGTSVIVT